MKHGGIIDISLYLWLDSEACSSKPDDPRVGISRMHCTENGQSSGAGPVLFVLRIFSLKHHLFIAVARQRFILQQLRDLGR